MGGPLEGIRVFDWSLYVVGPFATMLLGSLGAEVIKVEGPAGMKADRQIGVPPMQNGASALYINCNMNKKAVTLDLEDLADREAALKLLSTCDVFLNNMRAFTPEKLGLSYETVVKYNPRIVYCVATGYGHKGPMALWGGADPQEQAFGGWSSITGQPGGRGELLRHVFHIDINTSLYIAAAILEALYARERTGLGQFVDVTMHGAAIALQRTRLAEYLATGVQPPLLGSGCATAVPHQAFLCQDQQYLAVGVEDDSQWQGLCAALGAKDLALDPRFAHNPGRVEGREELLPRLQALFQSKPLAWWQLQMGRHRVPCGRLGDFEILKYHPQITQNRYMPVVKTPWGPVYTGGVPWAFSETPARMEGGIRPGQDSEAILPAVRRLRLEERAAPAPLEELEKGPLTGLKVVELAQGFAGPYCGQMLADGGAEVVKVEPPEGDYARRLGPPLQGGESPPFLSLNRNKRSVVLDGAQGGGALQRLLEEADVVLADWRDTKGRRTRPSYADAARMNPKVVFCSISPYGERGPLREQPGTELTVQFMTGVPRALGRLGEPPVRVGADMASMYAGVYAYQGVLAALYHRDRTGQGQRVAVSLLGSMVNARGLFWAGLTSPQDWLPPHLNIWTDPPNHGILTRDLPVLMGFSRYSREDLDAILQELGADRADAQVVWDSMEGRLPRNAPQVEAVWRRALARHAAKEVIGILGRHNGEVIPVNDYPSLVAHPQTKVLEIFQDMEHPTAGRITLVGPGWRLRGTPAQPFRTPPPLLGQHTEEVMIGMGAEPLTAGV